MASRLPIPHPIVFVALACVAIGLAGPSSLPIYSAPASESTAAPPDRSSDLYVDAVYARVVTDRAAAEAAAVAAQVEADRQAAEEAAAAQARSTPRAATVVTVPSSGACSGAFDCFRACTIEIESHGNYAVVSSNGLYSGAWQFAAGTWVNAVTASGHPEWAGVTADQAPPAIQDAAAAALYATAGNQPWGGRC